MDKRVPDKKKFQIEPDSRVWLQLKEYIEHRIRDLLTGLANDNNSRTEDLILKGQVKELRQMLALGKPPPEYKVQGRGT